MSRDSQRVERTAAGRRRGGGRATRRPRMTIACVLELTALSLRVCSTAMGKGGLGHQNGYRFDREPGRGRAASRGVARPARRSGGLPDGTREAHRAMRASRLARAVRSVLTLCPTRRGLRRRCIRSRSEESVHRCGMGCPWGRASSPDVAFLTREKQQAYRRKARQMTRSRP